MFGSIMIDSISSFSLETVDTAVCVLERCSYINDVFQADKIIRIRRLFASYPVLHNKSLYKIYLRHWELPNQDSIEMIINTPCYIFTMTIYVLQVVIVIGQLLTIVDVRLMKIQLLLKVEYIHSFVLNKQLDCSLYYYLW